MAIPLSRAEALCAGIGRRTELVVIKGAAHAANLTHPAAVNPPIRGFLRSLRADPACGSPGVAAWGRSRVGMAGESGEAGVALFKRRRHGVYLACGGRRARRGNDRTLFQPKPGEAACCHENNWRQQ